MTEFADKKFLIIAGQPKAGTTSLFDWMAQHPDVCGSTLKETRFFLDPSYPLPRPKIAAKNDVEGYASLFVDHDKPVMLEATPDYLYSERFLEVAKLLPNARVIIVIRDHQARLVSAFQFFKQNGLLSQQLLFDDWIAQQRATLVDAQTPVQLRALDHCDTDKYLDPVRTAFGDRLLVIAFSDLKENPSDVIARICNFMGLSPIGLDQTALKASNRTSAPRWPLVSRGFDRLHRGISQRLLNLPFLRAALRPFAKAARSALRSNAAPQDVTISPETQAVIANLTARNTTSTRQL